MTKVQLEFPSGELAATIDSQGAALVGFSHGDKQLVGQTELKKFYSGVVMAPWSGRIESGVWVDRLGESRRLEINEPERANSLHGLVYNQEFSVLEQTSDSVALEIEILESDQYPYRLLLSVLYRLSAKGLTCRFEVVNRSDVEAEFGIGFHPYFLLSGFEGGEPVIQNSARTFFSQGPSKIPLERLSVSDHPQNLLGGKGVLGSNLDDYYTDLNFDWGLAFTRLTSADGYGVEVWQEPIFKHLVIYTTDEFPTSSGTTDAVAIEPSTSAVNALNNKQDLLIISPGKSVEGSWGISILEAKGL